MNNMKKQKSVIAVDNRLAYLIGSCKRSNRVAQAKWICLTLNEAEDLLKIVRQQLNKAPPSIRFRKDGYGYTESEPS